jgi:TIR domain
MSYKYDLAISFAGEQRGLADTFARRLDASGYSIFYDEFQQAELWGRDLSIALNNVYSKEARYCLILLSDDYVQKPWTNLERQSAISQFIERRGDYILCLKVEDIDLPGFPSIISYISLGRFDVDAVYKLLLQKLGPPDHDNQVSHLDSQDRSLARKIIEACFRRAIYTRMDSEINLSAMYSSIGKALGVLQQLTIQIHDQALQVACGEIIRALDDIDRAQTRSSAGVSNHLPQSIREKIDLSKQKVVRLLLEIRRAAKIPMQLPFAIQTDHFWGAEQADEKPREFVA